MNPNNSFDDMLKNIKNDDVKNINEKIIINKDKIIDNIVENNNKSIILIKPITIKKSIEKNNTQNISFIHEVNCNDIEELKKRITNIIIIRQYINTF